MYEGRGDFRNRMEFKFTHRSNIRPKRKNITSLLKFETQGSAVKK